VERLRYRAPLSVILVATSPSIEAGLTKAAPYHLPGVPRWTAEGAGSRQQGKAALSRTAER
jgi:hypothetical protein